MKTRVHSARITIDVHRTETIKHDNGSQSWRSVPDGTKSAIVDLWIDAESLLLDLAARALRNKSGRAHLAGGDIEAIVNGGTVERVKP